MVEKKSTLLRLAGDFTRQSRGDKVFDICNYIFLGIVLMISFYPLYFIVIASISDPAKVAAGDVWLFPTGMSLAGYEAVFENESIWQGYANTVKYTAIGTFVNIVFTIPAAYALSRKELIGRKFLMAAITFTMFFSGGLIPTYLVVDTLGLNNSMWALILPCAVSAYNLIVAKSYFDNSIPMELCEAGQVDGCTHFHFFFKVVLPLAKPILGVMVLLYAVAHWNAYFNALIFIRTKELYPLQVILRELLIQKEAAMGFGNAATAMEQQRMAEMLKYSVIIVSTLPILCVYPFVQKYFVKGVMLGAIKG